MKKLDYQKLQVEKRTEQLLGPTSSTDFSIPETQGLPDKVESDRGVAIKVGGFYEIIEFEEGDK